MAFVDVTIDQGTLRGTLAKDILANVYYKFRGIPYAKPPLGDLRFKAPQPPEKWSGIYDATKHGDICYQGEVGRPETNTGSEDCLFINVYTRRIPANADEKINRPVMFWIHPGDFIRGSGNENKFFPKFLIAEDVVLVTFNYRLGLLGFINFEDPSLGVPGNAGFKDQVMALRWVQNNISKFGGDPNNVTIFGENAGGISVHLLVLSPMSQGLFHKAIAQNGSYLSLEAPGTKGTKPLAKAMKELGFTCQDEKRIYAYLKIALVDDILELQTRLNVYNRLTTSKTWIPAVWGNFGFVIEESSTEPFLDQKPQQIISSGKFNQIPLMIGYTTGEGMFVRRSEDHIRDFKPLLPWYLGYHRDAPEREAVTEKIIKFYYSKTTYTTARERFDLMSDCQFIFGTHAAAANYIQVSKAPLYLYRIAGQPKRFIENITATDVVIDHLRLYASNIGGEGIAVVRLLKLWTNFAKFGNPTPDPEDPFLGVAWKPTSNDNLDWKPACGKDLDFLSIGRELEIVTNPDAERVNFWKRLYAESPAAQGGDVPAGPGDGSPVGQGEDSPAGQGDDSPAGQGDDSAAGEGDDNCIFVFEK